MTRSLSGSDSSAKKGKEYQTIDLDVLQAYNRMLEIRLFEEAAAKFYRNGLIGGFCHLYIGQEAVITGTELAISPKDSIITGYRCHAHLIARGGNMGSAMAELLGRETGVSKGKGGSMHMFDLEKNFFGGHGIVGAQVPLGTGIAFANKYRTNNNICVTFFGDGAANQGQVYESFNMAKLWNLPIIYIIENNFYSMGTSTIRGCANSENLYQRAAGFDIPGYQVDGMDVFAVYEAVKQVAMDVRTKGPALIEMQTYRYRGHSMSDPAKYRTKEEVSHMKEKRDPILNLQTYLTEKGIASEKDIEEINKTIAEKIQEACEFAMSSNEPDLKELYTDVIC